MMISLYKLFRYFVVSIISIFIIISCSGVRTAVPCPGAPTVTYAGKTYNTVLIGDMCWLRENLDAGMMIDSSENASNNFTLEKYCYRNNPENCAAYGGLYQWDEAMQYSVEPGSQGICPEGWHIPTLDEFYSLWEVVDSSGNALKEFKHGSGKGIGNNTSGFTALFTGYLSVNGYFADLRSYTYFWSSTEYKASAAYSMLLLDYSDNINVYDDDKKYGFSVRCLKN